MGLTQRGMLVWCIKGRKGGRVKRVQGNHWKNEGKKQSSGKEKRCEGLCSLAQLNKPFCANFGLQISSSRDLCPDIAIRMSSLKA